MVFFIVFSPNSFKVCDDDDGNNNGGSQYIQQNTKKTAFDFHKNILTRHYYNCQNPFIPVHLVKPANSYCHTRERACCQTILCSIEIATACFAGLAMMKKTLFMSLRGAKRRSNLSFSNKPKSGHPFIIFIDYTGLYSVEILK